MKVIASLAIKAAYLELVPAFERQSSQRVQTEWVGMMDIRKRVLAGEVADAVIGSAALIAELGSAGLVQRKIDLASSAIGAAVRAGAPKPDIGSVDKLKAALRKASSIVYSSGPSGVYLAELFERLGIARDIRATQAPPGVLVGERVAQGEFELCFQQVPELRQVKGIDYVGLLPAEVQLTTMFSGAVHTKASEPKPAEDWLRYLTRAEAQAVLRRHGLDPA